MCLSCYPACLSTTLGQIVRSLSYTFINEFHQTINFEKCFASTLCKLRHKKIKFQSVFCAWNVFWKYVYFVLQIVWIRKVLFILVSKIDVFCIEKEFLMYFAQIWYGEFSDGEYWGQTSSRLCKTVVDYDYDYFQFMKEDYNYTFIFASEIMITYRLQLNIFCLITITSRLWLQLFLFDCNYKITQLQFDWTKFIICMLILLLLHMHCLSIFIWYSCFIIIYEWKTSLKYL